MCTEKPMQAGDLLICKRHSGIFWSGPVAKHVEGYTRVIPRRKKWLVIDRDEVRMYSNRGASEAAVLLKDVVEAQYSAQGVITVKAYSCATSITFVVPVAEIAEIVESLQAAHHFSLHTPLSKSLVEGPRRRFLISRK